MLRVRRMVSLCFPWMATLLIFSAGCASIPDRRSAVNSVRVRGAKQIDGSDLEDKIATMPSPKFLGLFRGVVYDYELYNRATLQRDLARIERYYRARGYYDAHATAGLVTRVDSKHVKVQIEVEEGAPVRSQPPRFDGADTLPKEIADSLRVAVTDLLPPGDPFDEDKFEDARIAAQRALTDGGYAYAKVEHDALVDLVRHEVTVIFTVQPGARAVFGQVTIAGRSADGKTALPLELPIEPLMRAIDIHEGDPYSTAALDSATAALFDLGVLSSVDMEPELPDTPPANHIVPLHVFVEPSRLRHLRLGGGVEFDAIKTQLHVITGWEDHNFIGGLRALSIAFQPGVVLYPLRVNHFVVPDRLLPEERLRVQLKQPGFIEARTNGYVRPEFNIFPMIFSIPSGAESTLSIVGYREVKGATSVERSYGKTYTSLGYNLQVENPFTYRGPLDPALSTLVISFPELMTSLDLRDDRVHPHKGFFVSNSLQVAGGIFGGTARDVRIQPELRTYLPIGPNITFATRATIGWLLPSNYGDVVQHHLGDNSGDPTERVRDIETVYFRGFFSGGPNSNRGYPIRGIAPHGAVPFLNPATAAGQVAANCDPNAVACTGGPEDAPGCYNASACSIPIGGFTMWELSNEVRFDLKGPLSAALFCDMSDVSAGRSDIRLSHLHLACGGGIRYDTPVGPIRFDLGYRIQPLQVVGQRNEDDVARTDPIEGAPPKLLGIPLAFAFGIGEAY
jgi:outer membrane protein assembly factor BamA